MQKLLSISCVITIIAAIITILYCSFEYNKKNKSIIEENSMLKKINEESEINNSDLLSKYNSLKNEHE